MTRDEAVSKITEFYHPENGERLIDALTVLGLLTLEQPKTPKERFFIAMGRVGYLSDGIETALSLAGVEIVDKK